MDDMQNKLNSILENPQMMQQIMAMAQSMGGSTPPPPPQEEASGAFVPDAAMLQQIMGFAQKSGIDNQQQALLNALAPYLTHQRISKLERAMRAAKIAGAAAAALGSGALSFLTGR